MMKATLRLKKMSGQALATLAGLMTITPLAAAASAPAQQQPAISPVTIPSCAVSSATPLVDFGRQSRGQLKDVPGGMSPGSRRVAVSLTCNVIQPLKLRINGPAYGDRFLYGADGQLKVTVVRSQLDGKSVQLQAKKGTGPWAEPSTFPLLLSPADLVIPLLNGQPAKGHHLTVMLQLEPLLGHNASRPTQESQKQSQLTFSREP